MKPAARPFDPVQLGSIDAFCKAAELGSFTAAAQALGLTPAAVSRSVGRLEQRLGVRLLARSTRSMRLTTDGALYFAECQQALAQIAAAEKALSGRQREPQGLLRLSLPTTYAHHRVLPLLPAFSLRYPKVLLDVDIDNRNVDLIDEGFDLAVRLGEPRDSRLVARRLEDAALAVYATPAYLAARGTPQTLDELAAHTCFAFVLPSTGRALPWLFRREGQDVELPAPPGPRVRGDVLGAVRWAATGGGLVQTYRFIAHEAVQRGELVEILRAHAGRSRPFSLLYPHNRHLSTRVRALVNFLAEAVEQAPR